MKVPPLTHALLLFILQGENLEVIASVAMDGNVMMALGYLWQISSLFFIGVAVPCKRDWKRAQRFCETKTRYPY